MEWHISDLVNRFDDIYFELFTYQYDKFKDVYTKGSATLKRIGFIWAKYKDIVKQRVSKIPQHTFCVYPGLQPLFDFKTSVSMLTQYSNIDSFYTFEREWMKIFDLLVTCVYYTKVNSKFVLKHSVKQTLDQWFSVSLVLLDLWKESFTETACLASHLRNPHREVLANIPAAESRGVCHNKGATSTKSIQQVNCAASSLKQHEVTISTSVHHTSHNARKNIDVSNPLTKSIPEQSNISGMVESQGLALRCENDVAQLNAEQKLQSENEDLKKQLAEEQDEKRMIEQRLQTSQLTRQLLEELVDSLNRKLVEEQENTKVLKEELELNFKRFDGIRKELEERIRNVEHSNASLMEQLHDEQAARKATGDKIRNQIEVAETCETHIFDATSRCAFSCEEHGYENISLEERPLNIITQFKQLCFEEWLCAKQAIDEMAGSIENLTEQDRCSFICDIIQECYETSNTLLGRLLVHVKHQLSYYLRHLSRRPLQTEPLHLTFDNIPEEKAPHISADELILTVKRLLRHDAHNVEFDDQPLVILKDIVLRKGFPNNMFQSNKIEDYTRECLKLCWKMVLQQPAMTIDCKSLIGKAFVDTDAELYEESVESNDLRSRVQYYAHPSLYYCGRVMHKAKVCLTYETD